MYAALTQGGGGNCDEAAHPVKALVFTVAGKQVSSKADGRPAHQRRGFPKARSVKPKRGPKRGQPQGWQVTGRRTPRHGWQKGSSG